MVSVFDWKSLEDRLFEQSKAFLIQFAAEHPDIVCSFFAYDTNPPAGEFLLSFDSEENMYLQAKKHEQREIAWREQRLKEEWSWRYARYDLRSVSEGSPDVGYFAYHMYAEIYSEDLEEFCANETYPQITLASEDDYIDGNVRILLWKVIERLVANEAFAPLHLASPFRIGYQLHDDGQLMVLRLLNWAPEAKQ